jgi:dihydroneopterin aldolase/D-erythro-7,8-dihydroneopterin triphosphate epimerase
MKLESRTMTPDRILIKDLLLRAIVGINDDERTNRQDVVINLVLEADTRPAAKSDDIADAVNYRTIAKQVIDFVEASEFLLVEKLASEIAKVCLADRRVMRVQVTVEKPTALRFAGSVGVSIHRTREDFPELA